MNAWQKAENQADKASTKAGVKLTPKRKHLLMLLLNSPTPLSAYELAEAFKTQYGQSIPAMSVYRMLDFLTDNNLAHKLASENKFVSCAHSQCDHQHQIPQFLICEKCQQVKEIGIAKEVFETLKASVESSGFHLMQSQIELKCLCENCANSG